MTYELNLNLTLHYDYRVVRNLLHPWIRFWKGKWRPLEI